MKPILYAASTTNFNNNGIGPLSDCISCKCTQSEGTYELQLEYPTTGVHYKDIHYNCWLKVVVPPQYETSPQLFYIVKITRPINKRVTILAHHVSYRLNHIPISPYEAANVSGVLTGLASHPVETALYSTFPFTFTTDQPNTSMKFKMEQPCSAMEILGGTDESILKQAGGHYIWDNYNVQHVSTNPDRGYQLRYGVNITDLKQEENISETITGIVPFWYESRYEKEETHTELKMLPEKVLYASNADQFPFRKTVTLDMSSSFDEKPSDADLRSVAQLWMQQNKVGVPQVSLDVSFVELCKTEEFKGIGSLQRINLYDTVTVIFADLNVNTKAFVTQTVYDVLLERYDSVQIGETQKLSSSINNTVQASFNTLKQESLSVIANATNMITGGGGGYIVYHINEQNDYPDEIFIMNTPSTATATNVIRINQNGIGFSMGNGINGPYESAWTIDGKFNASFVKTGTLDASQVNVTNINANNITSGTIDAQTINVDHLNADNVNRGSLDSAYVDGATDDDITAVNWDGDLLHFYFNRGVGQRYWVEPSVYWIQVYHAYGGDGTRG